MASVSEIDQNPLRRSAREAGSLLSEVVRTLRFYADAGYGGGECGSENLECVRFWADPDCLRLKKALPDIAAVGTVCKVCPLQASRPHMIAGAGPAGARLMFVLGYPSFPADKENSPYAGEAGRLLVRIMAAMKLTPDDVYVSHIVKCRSSDGREASAEGVRCCISLLEREIKSVAPEVICVFGEFAARSLLNRSEPLERLRGRFYERGGVEVMPTWHPDDMIDDPDKKKPVWEDIRKVMARLDIT